MDDFNKLFRDVIRAGKKIGENIGKSEMKCPRCRGSMCLFKKYSFIDMYFWTCDCGINFPERIGDNGSYN